MPDSRGSSLHSPVRARNRGSHLLLLGLAVGLLLSPAVQSATPAAKDPKVGPTATLKNLRAEVDTLLEPKLEAGSVKDRKRDKKLKKIINRLFDFETLARLALGAHWEPRTKKERKEYVDVLTALIEMNYLDGLKNNSGYSLDYVSEGIVGDKAVVKTMLTTRSGPKKKPVTLAVDYKMALADGTWQVVDIITDEDSLVELYRAEFNKVISKSGFATLMSKLNSKLKEGPGAGDGGDDGEDESGAISGGASPPSTATAAH